MEDLIRDWTEQQLEQAAQAIYNDQLDFSISCSATPSLAQHSSTDIKVYQEEFKALTIEGLNAVGGLDISFSNDGNDGVATLVVLSFPDLQIISETSKSIHLATPYIPSFLSFREAAPLADLVASLRLSALHQDAVAIPQLLFVDGNGRLHERQAGSAVVVGLFTGIPTIGVAKEYHPFSTFDDTNGTVVDSMFKTQKGMREGCRELLKGRGDWLGLYSPDGGETIGAALLTSPAKDSTRPLFVSPGHLISLETSIRLTLLCCTVARVPEPVRLADSIGREEVRKQLDE